MPKLGGDRLERLTQRADVGLRAPRVELDPHEEIAGLRVVELLRVENVEPAVEQRRRDLGDDPRPVGAGQGEDVPIAGHQSLFVAPLRGRRLFARQPS